MGLRGPLRGAPRRLRARARAAAAPGRAAADRARGGVPAGREAGADDGSRTRWASRSQALDATLSAGNADGGDAGLWEVGATAFTVIVVIANTKLALNAYRFTALDALVYALSVGSWRGGPRSPRH